MSTYYYYYYYCHYLNLLLKTVRICFHPSTEHS